MTTRFFDTFASPFGLLTIVASAQGLHQVIWANESLSMDGLINTQNNPVILVTKLQLSEYFAGKRKSFDLPLAPEGTVFQRQVWQELQNIPYGETISYGEQARRLGNKNKARAVGLANGKNPIPIIVPCHRVIGSNGHLTGFAGGLNIKEWLLKHEYN